MLLSPCPLGLHRTLPGKQQCGDLGELKQSVSSTEQGERGVEEGEGPEEERVLPNVLLHH